jgi:aspartate aminotransferase-like enzyme
MGALGRNDILGMLGSLELALAEQGYPVRAGAGVSAALETFLESDRAPAPALAL